MAGVRRKALQSGKFQGWFIDFNGKRKFFVGTRGKAETLRIAERLEDEHRQVRLGYRPAPKPSGKHRNRLFSEISQEYLDWGESQGGRGGRPWAKDHARMRRSYLHWWQKTLGLETLSDLDGILPRVEEALREILATGRSGKTATNYVEALKGFSNWCIEREYLDEDPLKSLVSFDITPATTRRAMTPEEIRRLLQVAPWHRQLLYVVAFTTGLRAGELRNLTVDHLDVERCGLRLDAEWTKNRKPGFQPLPRWLVGQLQESIESRTAEDLYRSTSHDRRSPVPEDPLLFVPRDPSCELDKDLAAAGISKETKGGKVDFHAFRVAYVSMVLESGASAKEAQTLARHSTPGLTMNTYARAREDRLAELTERVAENVLPEEMRAHSVHKQAVGAEDVDPKFLNIKELLLQKNTTPCGFDSRPAYFSQPQHSPNRPSTKTLRKLTDSRTCSIPVTAPSQEIPAFPEQSQNRDLHGKCAYSVQDDPKEYADSEASNVTVELTRGRSPYCTRRAGRSGEILPSERALFAHSD